MGDQSPSPKALGMALRGVRRDSGMSIRSLAKSVSLSHQYVAQLEQGERSPTLETTLKLAGALGVAPGDLLDRAQILEETHAVSGPSATDVTAGAAYFASLGGQAMAAQAMNMTAGVGAPSSPATSSVVIPSVWEPIFGGVPEEPAPTLSEAPLSSSEPTLDDLIALVRALPEGSRAVAARKLRRLVGQPANKKAGTR